MASALKAITNAAMPALGAGFGDVPYAEVARQMATAYDNFLHPPSHLDWDVVIERHRRVAYDGDRKVINETKGDRQSR